MDLTPESSRRFELDRRLGKGGYGEVFAATMTSAGGISTRVAVKLLHAELDPNGDAVQRMRDEGRLLGVLDHPSILRVIDLVELGGKIALVTEYIEGCDLKGCLRPRPAEGVEREPMPLRPLVEVIGRVADALDVASRAKTLDGRDLGLVHRDVKPANIRVGRRGEVKLLDFGIARASLRDARTSTQVVLGSFGYLAPERFDPGREVRPASDVFSLGCVLYEGIAHAPLLGSLETHEQVALSMDRQRFEGFVGPKVEALGAPAEVLTLLRAMLAFEEEERPTADEVSTRCEALAEELDGAPLRRWCKTWPWPEDGQQSGERRTLVEGVDGSRPSTTGRPPAGASDTLDRGDRTGSWGRVGLIGVGVTGVGAAGAAVGAAGVLALVLALVVLLRLAWSDPAAAPPAPAAVEPAPAAVEPAPAEAVPAPSPSPTEAAPTPAEVEPAPEQGTPAAVEPAPEQATPAAVEPAPAHAPSRTAKVTATGPAPMELRRPGYRPTRGGTVPAGRWTVFADFGAGLKEITVVDLAPGDDVAIQCSRVAFSCSVSR